MSGASTLRRPGIIRLCLMRMRRFTWLQLPEGNARTKDGLCQRTRSSTLYFLADQP
jgi:hypothetical protein